MARYCLRSSGNFSVSPRLLDGENMKHLSGYRPVTRASLEARQYVLEENRSVSRRELSEAAREAAEALTLPSSWRQVLHELVGVYGEVELAGRILVWPSNDYLMTKTGLAERTLRYVIKALIAEGLIGAKDSANGKRFGIRNAQGQIIDAYGFDLTPLYGRRGEFQNAIARQKLHRTSLRRVFDQITSARRAIAEALTALSNAFPDVYRSDLEGQAAEIARLTPRRGYTGPLEPLFAVLEQWTALREAAEFRFYEAGSGGQDCRHIESDNEPSSITCQESIEDAHVRQPTPEVPPELVAQACPAYRGYYDHPIRSERELVAAAEFLRPMIGAHVSAWNEAKELLGAMGSAAVLLMVLQRYDENPDAMRNPGGYFRAMARTVAERKFNLTVTLMEMRRKRLAPDHRDVSSP